MANTSILIATACLDRWLEGKFHPEDDRLQEFSWNEIKEYLKPNTKPTSSECRWFEDRDEDGDDVWAASCGHYVYQSDSENFHYCPYCSYVIRKHNYHPSDVDAWEKEHS